MFGGGGFDSFATESDVKSFKETEKEEVKNFSLEILEKMFAEKILQVSNWCYKTFLEEIWKIEISL